MNYEDWADSVPNAITGDRLWRLEAYRLALFLADVGWHDVTKLIQDKRTLNLSDQLYRSVGSISANLAEGYSRSTGKDRARFYEYALGSARESRDWYYKGRHTLGEEVIRHRLGLITQIIRLLLTMVPNQRGGELRERKVSYQVTPEILHSVVSEDGKELNTLLQNVPFPHP
ncbi:MAG: four helix bundle protein [Acidobacteria bacterium]|nr:MAG: four helix bundle protein [Acidobacteriota bacterium]